MADAIPAVDLARIQLGDPIATADAIAYLLQKVTDEAKIRSRDIGRRAPIVARVVRVYLDNNQSVATGTYTKIQMASRITDHYGEWDTTNYRFIPKLAGMWLAIGRVYWDASKFTAAANWYKNGVEGPAAGFSDTADVADEQIPQIIDIHEMNGTSDYLELFGLHQAGVNTNALGSQKTRASFIYLGRSGTV